MKITAKTGSWAARYVSERVIALDMPEGSSAMDVIKAIGIPPDEVGIVVIDGKSVPKEHRLSDEDVIKIHPVIIGG